MRGQIYVYATDSHTETAIKDFLKKINPNVHWVIRSPLQRKMPKKDYANKDNLPRLTGRTGLELENFMIEEIKDRPSILTKCVAIVLEDDLDFRDSKESQDEYLSKQQKKLDADLSAISAERTAKLICLYAAPEIETWLIEDWKNSFGNKNNLDQRISTELRKFLNSIKDKCDGNYERYSHYFEEKFSDSIIKNIRDLACKFYATDIDTASYNKAIDGAKFLRAIDPHVIEPKCRLYFAKAYHAIKDIQCQ